MNLSLLFFGAVGAERQAGAHYQLFLDCAKFADQYGFDAVWTPERHFEAFGGFYPNPAVTSAALSTVTQHIRLRAGSVILPLHDPIRVAEEWALVDVLSNGRAEVSFGSGWHVNDFVLHPGGYASRRQDMLSGIDTVRRLWRGDHIRRTNGDGREVEVRILPRPVQSEIPIWLTCQSVETFEEAGRRGYSVLTNLSFNVPGQLAERISRYRQARRAFDGECGHVALMVHTFVGVSDREAEAVTRPALRTYLRHNLALRSSFSAAKGRQEETDTDPDSIELEPIIDRGVQRLYKWAGLIGSPDTCRQRMDAFRGWGVDELACLIDFGVEPGLTMESLPRLKELLCAPTNA